VYRIVFTPSAEADLAWLRKSEQRLIVSAVTEHLSHDPLTVTLKRKPLRPNPIARWALRIEEYRVLYNPDPTEKVVTVRAVGYKDHNTLYIRGTRIDL
jgi:mRNA-degrading endonuclease RelE of RelBE toxin-antitoxin system